MLVLQAHSLRGSVSIARRVTDGGHSADSRCQALHDLMLALVIRTQETHCLLSLTHQPRKVATGIRGTATFRNDGFEDGLKQRSGSSYGGCGIGRQPTVCSHPILSELGAPQIREREADGLDRQTGVQLPQQPRAYFLGWIIVS